MSKKLDVAMAGLGLSLGYSEREDGKVDVHYSGAGLDARLDKRIEAAMEELGYARKGSGYNLMSEERDIAFEKS